MKGAAMVFTELSAGDARGVAEMSAMATSIVRECFDPLIGREQNDHMLALFQTESAIRGQIADGSRYFFVRDGGGRDLGFLAFRLKGDVLYLSKFYLYRGERGKGLARGMMDFVIAQARQARRAAVELNVNRNNAALHAYERMGFRIAREEKKDIGGGFFMDDYVCRLDLPALPDAAGTAAAGADGGGAAPVTACGHAAGRAGRRNA